MDEVVYSVGLEDLDNCDCSHSIDVYRKLEDAVKEMESAIEKVKARESELHLWVEWKNANTEDVECIMYYTGEHQSHELYRIYLIKHFIK